MGKKIILEKYGLRRDGYIHSKKYYFGENQTLQTHIVGHNFVGKVTFSLVLICTGIYTKI